MLYKSKHLNITTRKMRSKSNDLLRIESNYIYRKTDAYRIFY